MMAKPDPQATAKTQAHYDRIAPIYDLMEALMECYARKWRTLLWAQVEGKILEVGVGTGKNLPYYPAGSRVTAIDLSAEMLRRARRWAGREKIEVELLQMDAQALDFPDLSFDTVAASFVFCSVPNPLLGLEELGRVTKPAGKILLLEHMRPENPWLGRLFDLINPLVVRLFGFNINRRTLVNIEMAGLEIERVRNLNRMGIVKLIVAKPHGREKRKEVNRMAEKVKDHVCGMEIEKNEAVATCEYGGKTCYFCAPGCKRAFEKEPEKYLSKRGG